MITLTFKPLSESHFPLLLKWLEAPHVKKWWDRGIAYTLDLVTEKYGDYVKGYKAVDGAQKPIEAFVICANNVPVGYIQIYNAYDFPRYKSLTGLPEKLGAIDLFIGEEKYLGQNIGSQAISQFSQQNANRFSHIFVDPDVHNIAAIRTYEKAGFKKISIQQEPDTIWMILKSDLTKRGLIS
ncbi:MAG: GNAT family N-acetyltransferase [Alphaproteobacteria bacterium]|jgi:RimJ/RimL family protein N-acetyltransferase|nr:GNAT family N-acetyltransferase [Alphaproteobacteria bacterium]